MGLVADIPRLLKVWKDSTGRLGYNNVLFNIYEGDLLTYVLEDLKKQLSPQAYEQIIHRAAPINVLKRMIDKLSKIYAKPPVRSVDPQNDGTKKLVGFYDESLEINTTMSLANEFFNLFKYTLVEPFLDRGQPRLRVVPSDRFFVYSNDSVNPLRPTHLVKIMGQYYDSYSQNGEPQGQEHTLFYGYTDEEFVIFNEKGEPQLDRMVSIYESNPNSFGTNPYGKIPGVYINRSKNCLVPVCDTDTLQMTKLIPILLSDINFATMFQAFSIFYGIDIDEQEMKMAPNAFWRLKSDPNNPDGKPSIGVIKPEVDTDKVLNLIHAQLTFWMQSRNIKPGTIGVLNQANYQSGFSKMIDEMDTSEDRQKQVPYFQDAERQLYDLVVNHMHPVWLSNPDFEYKVSAPTNLKVKTQFAEQRPMVNQTEVIDDQIKLYDKQLESRAGALKKIYPDMSDDQIQAKILEIDSEQRPEPAGGEPGKNPLDSSANPAGDGT